jgi:hypothetical protein
MAASSDLTGPDLPPVGLLSYMAPPQCDHGAEVQAWWFTRIDYFKAEATVSFQGDLQESSLLLEVQTARDKSWTHVTLVLKTLLALLGVAPNLTLCNTL